MMRSGPWLWVFGVVLCGCSRPATREECEFIVRRVAELRLAPNLDSGAEARKSAENFARELETEIKKECVGRPITDGALECVRQATQPRQVIECFH